MVSIFRTRTLSTRVQGGGNSKAIVSSVLTALNPEIQRAVANALRSGSSRTVTSNVRRVSSSDSSTGALVSQIITILTPTIRSSVAQALAGRAVSQQSFTSSYQSNTRAIDRTESGVMKVLDALEPTIAAQVAAAIENMRQTQVTCYYNE